MVETHNYQFHYCGRIVAGSCDMKKLVHKSERLICTIIGVMFPHGNDASFEVSVQPQSKDAMFV